MKLTRIAMWSGPRNISTAMLRSWENRADTVVVDEPLYGPYLFQTGKRHPMYQEIINEQGKHYQPITERLITCECPHDISIFYQKHMAHHILEDTDLSWIVHLKNAILLRHPYEVLSSYLEKQPEATPEDIGYPQLLKLFKLIQSETGEIPPVFNSKDILINPEMMLNKMCESLEIPFNREMLGWDKGYRESDGVWAKHWYNSVILSTGFAKYKPKEIKLTRDEQKIADECMPYYEELSKYKIL